MLCQQRALQYAIVCWITAIMMKYIMDMSITLVIWFEIHECLFFYDELFYDASHTIFS